ncbi:MAG: class I SAM-dependent methyltransferase [Halarchaeum sp.]
MVPTTVRAALADQPVAGATCLEAGAGVGNTTEGLLAAGAERVYAVTDDPTHARATRERADDARAAVVCADVRAMPLPDDSTELITAHALCNVLSPAALDDALAEISRVAAPGARLVVDDYDPLPADARMREVVALANAASELASGESALTFYPARHLRRCCEGWGWTVERETTLLEPVPWTPAHVRAHRDSAREALADESNAAAAAVRDALDDLDPTRISGDAGRMYSLAFRRPA